MQREVRIDAGEGVMDAWIVTPDNVDGALPPVVLLTDIGALRPCYHDKAQHIADNGYAVFMPNVYYRDVSGPAVPAGRSFRDADIRPTLFEYAGKLSPAAQAIDARAWLSGIDSEPEFASGPVAVVGYCMSGGMALRLAANHPDRVAAAAGFHSSRLAQADDPDSPVHGVGDIKAQVYLGHADGDKLMPPEQIARMDGALADAGVHFTTELYRGADHGYTAKDAPAYDEIADQRHYKRLFTLLEETIRT